MEKRGVRLRAYQDEDYEQVFRIWKDRGLTLGVSDTREEIGKLRERNRDLCLVAVEAEQICGVVLGAWDGRRGYVHHLAVRQECEGSGIGRLLMSEVERRFSEMGIPKAHLFIETRNRPVQDFYEKSGWHDRPDLIMMSKNFNTEIKHAQS